MQGYQLAMVYYGIGVLPPTKILKAAYTDFTKPWYADDDGALGMFDNLELYFNSLKNNCPSRGYYPNTTKIILIGHPENIEAEICFGAHNGFKVCTGARYLSGYIGDDRSKRE